MRARTVRFTCADPKQFLRVSELLIEIGDDLYDYEDDVAKVTAMILVVVMILFLCFVGCVQYFSILCSSLRLRRVAQVSPHPSYEYSPSTRTLLAPPTSICRQLEPSSPLTKQVDAVHNCTRKEISRSDREGTCRSMWGMHAPIAAIPSLHCQLPQRLRLDYERRCSRAMSCAGAGRWRLPCPILDEERWLREQHEM